MFIVFGLSLVVEFAYATYTIFVSRGYRWKAIISSASIALLKMILIYKVVFAIETLPALVIGQALGTFIVMSFLPNKDRCDNSIGSKIEDSNGNTRTKSEDQ